ncbi:MAG: NAD(+) diphosphatase [Erysipelotrichaceae bacterium]|nr:NAD(+) diphosphatase [Erysipelotrichaceae bacterium]
MIQDIKPHVLDNHYQNKHPKDDSFVLIVRGNEILCRYDEEKQDIFFPCFKDFRKTNNVTFLFSIDEDAYFMISSDEMPQGYAYYGITSFVRDRVKVNHKAFAAFTAYHLEKWYEANQYCGKCGSRTEHDSKERALRCPVCGNVIYPRINPAVIVGVRNGEKLLLTRYARGFGHNALVAGFTEIGETVEETVRREVREETGLEVKNITYYKSQPWGIARDILMGFYCDVDGDDNITMDPSELKYAQWVNREDIVLQPSDYSLTNEMMKRFKENKDK